MFMRREPTNQQRDLQEACPHQNWLDIDLSQYDYYVRRSNMNPRETGFVSEEEPAEVRPFRRPTPALIRSWEIARAYREQGYTVIKDVQWGVHQLSKLGGPTFFLFIEYKEKPTTQLASMLAVEEVMQQEKAAVEAVSISLRVEKRRLKVLKAIAELRDQPLAELLEEIINNTLDGKEAFPADQRKHIQQLGQIYGLNEKPADGLEFEERE
jgi:hypothetical protein